MMKHGYLSHEMLVPTLKDLLSSCSDKYSLRPAFQFQDRKNDKSVTFRQFKLEVDALGTYLYYLGYSNCHIAVFGENSYEWIMTHFAVTCGKNVIVPIDKDLDVQQIAELLQHSKCAVVVYSNTYSDVVKRLQEIIPGITFLNMKTIPDMLEKGFQLVREGYRKYLDVVINKDDVASIVYTSGTTGKSKGVMLTHFNLSSCAHASCRAILNTGCVMLILPLHHTFGLVTSVLSVMYYGNPVYINKSLKKISADFIKSQPQVLCAVPMVVETLYKNIWTAARKQGKENMLSLLVKISDTLLKCNIDIRKYLFRSVNTPFGGCLDTIVSGGAPLDEKYINGFRSFGITVLNGYGITECGPVVSANRKELIIPGSVGIPLYCNEVKISEAGEILVKGSNVMAGYYHDIKANQEAFIDGWFRTGDLGRLDEHGALHITGRIKNLIILSNGENIAAEGIEQLVYTIPYVKEVIAYGKDDVIVAEVYLDEEVSDAKDRINEDVKALNQKLPLARNIGRIVIRDTEFPKTTTKKIKRNYGGN